MRLDWGVRGASELVAGGIATAVVVDVLSFTTAVTIAMEHGIAVRPHRWSDPSAQEVARAADAQCAVPRAQGTATHPSLSPASIAAAQGVSRLVLPSPNGSAICAELFQSGVTVLAASLRNAAAVAQWVGEHLGAGPVGVVAAGERWPEGSLRPAVEDLWGAGAVLAGITAMAGTSSNSPEAEAARAAYAAVAGNEPDALRRCASGIELIERGYAADVDLAGQCGASQVVPVLNEGWFTPPR